MTRVSCSLIGLVALALAGAATASNSATLDDSSWPEDRGYSIQIDNDLFSGTNRDQDYSWGGALTFASPRPGRLLRPLHAMRARLDTLLTPSGLDERGSGRDHQATQIGILAMTPKTLSSSAPLADDRPYASLLFATSSQIHVLDGGERVRFSSFTLGILGLHAMSELQERVHSYVDCERPLGWEHQISSGGELTARYVGAQQWLLDGGDSWRIDRPELKFTVSGSAGFLTEASVALSARWGRIQSPWWSFGPELGDYTAAPVAPATLASPHSPETFAFAGLRLKARAYNVFLQGQFRHSDLRLQGDDVAHVQAEAWLGLATKWSDARVTYAIHYASPEITREPADRSLIWAGINFEKSF